MVEIVRRGCEPIGAGGTSAPFCMVRSFSLVSLVSIGAFSAAAAFLLSWFVEGRFLEREGLVMTQLVQSIADTQGAAAYFAPAGEPVGLDGRGRDGIERFVRDVVGTPDTFQARVYDRHKRLLWASEPQVDDENNQRDNLARALAGQLAFERGSIEGDRTVEHTIMPPPVSGYVEYYIPVRDPAGTVAGVVELYKMPQALMQTIHDGTRLIWVGALLGGAFVYLVQLGLVRRAATVIRRQQEDLADTEKMAAIGEIAAAVVHGVRNPLAAIRASSEVIRDGRTDEPQLQADEIIAEADRLERSVRELLTTIRRGGRAGSEAAPRGEAPPEAAARRSRVLRLFRRLPAVPTGSTR